jgi:hypothetical protein
VAQLIKGAIMVRKKLLAGGIACNFALAGCTTLPELEEATGNIPVFDIVLRTKCELSAALLDSKGNWLPDTYAEYHWLRNWTAQADLTLQILDQATFAPGASVMEPLHNAYPNVGPNSISTAGVPGSTISAFPQSFAIAAGVSLGGQAQRTETMSFTFSVTELRDWRARTNTAKLCAVSDKMDLRGRLGLREWFMDATWPVVSQHELLYAGYHPKPGTAAATPQKNPAAVAPKEPDNSKFAESLLACSDETLKSLTGRMDDAEDTLKGAVDIATRAKSSFGSAKANVASEKAAMEKAQKTITEDLANYGAVLDPAVSKDANDNKTNLDSATTFGVQAQANIIQAKTALKNFDPTPESYLAETRKGIRAARDAIKAGGPNCQSLQANVSTLEEKVKYLLGSAETATKDIAAADTNIRDMKKYIDTATEFTSKGIDPPIASIGQSVQFILSYSGNVTPTWSFVKFKGPNSQLFSSGGTRTHTLNITFGPTNLATNAPNADVKQNQFYLQLNSIRPQSF